MVCWHFGGEIASYYPGSLYFSSKRLGRFIIYIDARNVLESLQPNSNPFNPLPLITHVLQLFNELGSKGIHIFFCWVSAHVD